MASRIARGIAEYLLKSEDPALLEQIRIMGGNSESFIEYELSFIEKETAGGSPLGYSGNMIPENEVRKILFTRRWRC